MLVNVKQFLPDQLAIITACVFGDRPRNGKPNWPEPIGQGMYKIDHFNLDLWIRGMIKDSDPIFDNKISTPRRPDAALWAFGVVDTPDQLLERAPFLATDPERKYVVSFTSIKKSEQDEYGGWRWKKWGPYLGNQKPTCEYLYDEPEIEEVFVYHIYEVE